MCEKQSPALTSLKPPETPELGKVYPLLSPQGAADCGIRVRSQNFLEMLDKKNYFGPIDMRQWERDVY